MQTVHWIKPPPQDSRNSRKVFTIFKILKNNNKSGCCCILHLKNQIGAEVGFFDQNSELNW